ncbi:MAG: ABC transporter ATP-binding protein [Cyanobacteria bacterium P01_E01_bin.43]
MPSIWQLLWQMIRYAQRLYWVDTLLWLGIIGLPIVPGVLIREFFNSLSDRSISQASHWIWIGLLLAVGLARVVVIFTGRITKTQHRFLMSGLIRHNLLHELLQRPGAELAAGARGETTSPGAILSFFRDDAFQIENTVVGTNEIFAEAVFAVISVGLLLSVNAQMTLLVFLPLCAIATLAHQAAHRLKRYRRASRQATQQVTGLIGEMLTAVQAVKVAGAEAQMLDELRGRCDRRRQKMVRDQVFSALLDSGFENIVSLGTGLILLVIAQSVNTQTTFTVGDFALFIYYLTFVTYFLGFLGSFVATTKQSEVSFERMAGLVGEWESESAGNPNPPTHPPTYSSTVRLASTMSSAESSAHAEAHPPIHPLTYPHPLHLKPVLGTQLPLPPLPPLVRAEPLQTLRVDSLTYHYPGSRNGITDISLTLQRGSLTVITGPVGAGKTTLLRVLLGLLPKQAGRLYWNDQEIAEPGNFLVPPQAAYTPQIPQLFSTSLRDNLLLGIDVETPEKLQEAIATAVFEQDIAAMPDGLETLVGTRGFRLSGGQKQRAAAARMLLRQPELLVFDDLSSALDVETEHRLWQRLFDMRREDPPIRPDAAIIHSPISPSPHSPTCLVVSHRPAVLARADQVILLEAGKMKFLGNSLAFQQRFFDRSGD